MGRKPCCSKELELNRGAWTALEDKILAEYIQLHGEGKWRNLPERAGLKRCGKSCRLRWLNYLRPGIKRGSITEEEEDLIIRLHKLLGNRWALIAGRLPGRTDNEIKNYWHTKLSKTLKPKCGTDESSPKSSSTTQEQSSEDQPKVAKKPRISEPQRGSDEDKKTSVVRTKATRFTKPVAVVPQPEDQASHDQFDHQRSSSANNSAISEIKPLPSSHDDQVINLEDRDSSILCQALISDFALDFDMDKDFLSGFFNTDWISELPCAENAGDQSLSESNVYDVDQGNVNSENTLMFPSEETLPLSSDLESIVSLIETDHLDNWLQV